MAAAIPAMVTPTVAASGQPTLQRQLALTLVLSVVIVLPCGAGKTIVGMACMALVRDEVHLLPAPVFQITASLQARRRLGLTATLVREDGKEDDVFALIGPKKFDVPWKEMD